MSQPALMLMGRRVPQSGMKVLHEVEKGQLSQKGMATQLGLTGRWVRKPYSH